MKKLLLATAVAALSLNTVQAAPTLYGKLNISLDQVSNKDFTEDKVTEVNSNASRIGVKGEEKITDSLSAVYLAEWEVSGDDDVDTLKARNRFAGLKFANVGTLKAGHYDSYFKTAAGGEQDIFNDLYADMKSAVHGEERLKNVVGFETDPSLLGGLQFNIMLQQGEGSASAYTEEERDGLGDGVSTSVTYENDDMGLAVALAGNFGVPGDYKALGLKDVESDAVRLTGSLDFSNMGMKGFVLGGMWQTAELSDSPSAATLATTKVGTDSDGNAVFAKPAAASAEESAWGVTASFKIPDTALTIQGQYLSSETEWDGGEDTIDIYGMVASYKLNSATKAFGVISQIDQDSKKDETTVVGLGMEVKF